MESKTQIDALVAPWVQACLDRDWDALLALCTDDVVFAPPGEPSISGEESLKTWLDAFPVMTAFEFSFDQSLALLSLDLPPDRYPVSFLLLRRGHFDMYVKLTGF